MWLEEQLITGLQIQTNTSWSTSTISITDNGEQRAVINERLVKNISFKKEKWFMVKLNAHVHHRGPSALKAKKTSSYGQEGWCRLEHIHRWPKKLLHTVFNGGDVDGILIEGEEVSCIWPRIVVPLIAHPPLAQETSS